MKALANVALRLLTAVSTVFIAACYGIRYPERALRGGTVLDAQTSARIPGILVSCIANGGSILEQDLADAQGEFAMQPDCAEYRAEDVDGAKNGAYAPTTASFPGADPVVIRMDPVP